jgi:hypothetical protein
LTELNIQIWAVASAREGLRRRRWGLWSEDLRGVRGRVKYRILTTTAVFYFVILPSVSPIVINNLASPVD